MSRTGQFLGGEAARTEGQPRAVLPVERRRACSCNEREHRFRRDELVHPGGAQLHDEQLVDADCEGEKKSTNGVAYVAYQCAARSGFCACVV